MFRLSQSSSDSDHNSDEEEVRPPHMQSNQPHPLANQQQRQQLNSHLMYSDEDIDSNLNIIEDEQKMEPSDLAWNSNSMYDRLEPLDDEKPIAAEEQAAAPQINSSILSQVKSRSVSTDSSGTKMKSSEGMKSLPLHAVMPPPPPPPPKIPSGQFVAPPYSPNVMTPQVVATNSGQQRASHSTGGLVDSTMDGLNERAIDCGKDEVIRRAHTKEPPKPETVATRNAIMAWMMEQQSK